MHARSGLGEEIVQQFLVLVSVSIVDTVTSDSLSAVGVFFSEIFNNIILL